MVSLTPASEDLPTYTPPLGPPIRQKRGGRLKETLAVLFLRASGA